MSAQNDCRQRTASLFASGKVAASGEQGQSAVAASFSDCMLKAGWHLNNAKPQPVQTAAATAPLPQARKTPYENYKTHEPVQRQRQQQPAVIQQQVVTKQVPVQAAPQPRTLAPTPQNSVATYQPGRPSTTVAPDYGTGAGRSF